MSNDTLLSSLTHLIAEHLARSQRSVRDREQKKRQATDTEAKAIARQLISQAVAHGFQATVDRVESVRLGEGNTAQLVARINMPLSFVFKLDDSPKLVDEARLIQRLRLDDSLPSIFRERFPQVYALKDDSEPFAYLMEDFSAADGYESLATRLFCSLREEILPTASLRLINAALDALFEGYSASINNRLLPNIQADYLERIRGRLTEAAELDESFESVSVEINGARLPPWKEQLDQISNALDKLNLISPPFLCVVHGDPNPENIILKIDGERIDVRFIDPKAWEKGDYLFDMTKLVHYLWATGPVELGSGGRINVWKGPVIDYSIERESWVTTGVQLIRDRAHQFGKANNDSSQLDLRWDLGMAANLLGLPPARWKSGRLDEARILYAEGLVWLNRFWERFSKLM